MESTELRRLATAHLEDMQHWLTRDLDSAVALLNAVAAGECDDRRDDDAFDERVGDAYDMVMALLFSNAWNSDSVDEAFWETPMGQTALKVRLWLNCDELITISEAATILRGSANNRDRVYVNSLITRGELVRYIDPSANNPTHAGRVSRAEVERLRDA